MAVTVCLLCAAGGRIDSLRVQKGDVDEGGERKIEGKEQRAF